MTDSVTISLLPVTLSLVHVPRSRLDNLSQHILRQILLPNPTFLSVTCNEIELSVFAEHHTLADLEQTAIKDARKLKLIHKEASAASWRRRLRTDWEPVEISSDRWNVLQIDSHSDRQDNSGARVHELSAPLAAAGISILYQSSYMSDFIFVKDVRLAEVMSLLARAGFDLYSSDPNNLTSQLSTFTSPLLSPTPSSDETSVNALDLNALSLSQVPAQGLTKFNAGSGAVFSRSRSSTDATRSSSSSGSRASIAALTQMKSSSNFKPTMGAGMSDFATDDSEAESTPAPPTRPSLPRSYSHSPSSCEVRALFSDLTVVGLADDNVESWSLKIIKLIAFPELIPGVARGSRSSVSYGYRPPTSGSNFERGCPNAQPLDVLSAELEVDIEAGARSGSDTTTRVGPDFSPKKDPDLVRSGSTSPVSDVDVGLMDLDDDDDDADDDEAYDSDESSEDGVTPAEQLISPTVPDPEDPTRLPYMDLHRRPALTHQETARPSDEFIPPIDGYSASRCRSPSPPPAPPPLVPFFSFTRTSEGSSLTAPVSILSKLFPAHERHMVICSDELDVRDSRVGSPDDDEDDDGGVSGDDSDGNDDERVQGPLRCLQIDLRKFGLDKHGLVNRFSKILEESGINHMYSSTFKTANLLVDKADVRKAHALLRSC